MIALAAFAFNTAWAQEADDAVEYEVILPEEAQKCVLPAGLDAIPEQASYEDLVAYKKKIGEFQVALEGYRGCLRNAEDNPENTAGNNQAIISSFNYTVEMEERVAERFNTAVREYKARKAAEES
jgi:hypothetical protein